MKSRPAPKDGQPKWFINSFRLRNFKAIHDSGVVQFTPFTVFVGNNGSGKSSLVEGLQTLNDIATVGLDQAMRRWKGFQHVFHKSEQLKPKEGDDLDWEQPMSFELTGEVRGHAFESKTEVRDNRGFNDLRLDSEEVNVANEAHLIRKQGKVTWGEDNLPFQTPLPADVSLLADGITKVIVRWQFLSLSPGQMGLPRPQRLAKTATVLEEDGSGIGEYLHHLRNLDEAAFAGIVEALKFVLPYARDLQPEVTSELERTVHLSMVEKDFKVPGWLLSSGTLRAAALLAVLRHPTPSPLIVIEEIENGLDPRTIGLLLDEIRRAVKSGRSQIIATTHSPYLLDQVLLEHVITVERNASGEPAFHRPGDSKELRNWAKSFSLGDMYKKGLLGTQK